MKQEFKPLEVPPPQDAAPALDAKGEGPGDAFGLAGKPGGSDYLGGAGNGAGSAFGWYATIVQQRVQDTVGKQRKLREARFQAKVMLWFAADGRTERAELVRSTGKADIDRLLTDVLGAMPRLSEAPPKGMPQPVVLRVSTS